MNRFTALIALCISFLLIACQDNKEDAKNPVSEQDVYKTIGEAIPFETGMKWIAYYKNQESGEGRTDLLSFYGVPSQKMIELLESVSDLVGVAFHYGLDDNGRRHVLVIPVDESLSLWSSIPERLYVDANSGTEIDQNTASVWAQRYKEAHPSGIWFHFFGKNIFDEMRALPYFDMMNISPAINILNLTPQLLLIVYNNSLISLGRTQDDVPGMVYDASNACPPCAPK